MAEDEQSHDDDQQDDRARRQQDGDKPAQQQDDAPDKKDGAKGQDDKEQEQRNKTKPFVKIGLLVFVLALVAGGSTYWWLTRNQVSTDDAYTSGRTITVSSHVSGYVTELDVNDNEYVHEGQVLVRIDPRDYQASRDRAQASVDQAQGVSRQNFPG